MFCCMERQLFDYLLHQGCSSLCVVIKHYGLKMGMWWFLIYICLLCGNALEDKGGHWGRSIREMLREQSCGYGIQLRV